MKSYFDRLSQSLTSKILPIIVAAIFGYYSGIFGLKDEIYALKKENSEMRDLLRVEIAKVYKVVSKQKILIAKNEQYINIAAKPANNKLQELEKKIYLIERDIAIILVKDENISSGKNKSLSAKK